MKSFFKVLDIEDVLALKARFAVMDIETVGLGQALGRVLADDLMAPGNIPGFDRATMDGYAVAASSTYGASEANPAYLEVVGSVDMGARPDVEVGPGHAVRIATGGMLPPGADAVVMIEHAERIDGTILEVYRSVAPGQHMVAADDDVAQGSQLLPKGCLLRAQEVGLLAASGCGSIAVRLRPRVGIVSTGDELVPADTDPAPGQVRDTNTHTLAALVQDAGAIPQIYGIVGDRYDDLLAVCQKALSDSDMVLISGGSSVGKRDLTMEVLAALPQSDILVHGVSIRPGKPTILAQCNTKPFWGLPGHVVSAMVVFMVLVRPYIDHLQGRIPAAPLPVKARLARNMASVQGRMDFVRVRLAPQDGQLWAHPILGQSGLIHTMVQAHGLVAIAMNSEGLEKGIVVDVILM
jgi:molybdopterin molybdotransferase